MSWAGGWLGNFVGGWIGPVASERTNRGGGWGKDLHLGHHPRKKKTLQKYKKEYFSLSEFEIKEEVALIESTIKQARKDIEFNQDLGLADVIARLKAFITIEKVKLAALEQVEKEKFRRKKVDADLAFIAAYLMSEDEY